MKQTLLLLILLIPEACLAGEYSDCILENMKDVNDRLAVIQVKSACREKALPYVPEKCRDIPTGGLFAEYYNLDICTNNCLNASYWSKHFGDCKE
ncbi:MAG: hypothetical protein PHY16_02530 [Methylobacter sp.]|nr:hypothetical protein [Methylobacter sp.]